MTFQLDEALFYANHFSDLRSLLCIAQVFPSSSSQIFQSIANKVIHPFLCDLDSLESLDVAQSLISHLSDSLIPFLSLCDALFPDAGLLGDLVDELRSRLSRSVEALPLIVPGRTLLPRPLLLNLCPSNEMMDDELGYFHVSVLVQCLFAVWTLNGSFPLQLARIQADLLLHLRLAIKVSTFTSPFTQVSGGDFLPSKTECILQQVVMTDGG